MRDYGIAQLLATASVKQLRAPHVALASVVWVAEARLVQVGSKGRIRLSGINRYASLAMRPPSGNCKSASFRDTLRIPTGGRIVLSPLPTIASVLLVAEEVLGARWGGGS